MKSFSLQQGDYVSPGMLVVLPDECFPNMIIGDKRYSTWRYSRKEIPHNRYVDKRYPGVGFLNRDEAHIIYNTALRFRGKKALEIGCWLGWSACHLALAGVELDVIDPLLAQPEFYESVSSCLQAANILDLVNLIAGYSPATVEELASEIDYNWSLIFIDGNHEAPGPLNDAIACEKLAAKDALILFHDLASPDVSQGLDYLKQKGWNTMIYQTAQIMGVAWRGNVEPIQHQPDPQIQWSLPEHLQDYVVSGWSAKSPQARPLTVTQSYQSPLIPFNLTEINLICFPKWESELEIATDLEKIIKAILKSEDRDKITLLIESSSVSEEEATLLLSSVVMQIFMEEDVEVEEEPQICLLRDLSQRQRSALLPRIQYKIELDNENEPMRDKAASLPVIKLPGLGKGLQIEPSLSASKYRDKIIELVENNPGQMSVEEYSYITDVVEEKTPCNFLIFGVGKDSRFWIEVNTNGKTVFLEDNQDWLNQVRASCSEIDAYSVSYKTTRRQWLDLLLQHSQGIDGLLMELPESLWQTPWDFIFVDAPAGYADEVPGRMQSIYTAALLAFSNGNTDVFVHDCDRLVETIYSGYFLRTENLIAQVDKLKHYKIIDSSLRISHSKTKEVSLNNQQKNKYKSAMGQKLLSTSSSNNGVKILHIIQALSRGGAARSMIATAKYSSRMDVAQQHRVINLSLAEPGAVSLATKEGMYVINQPDKATIWSQIEWSDVVHVHFWNNPEIYELLQAELPAMRLLLWFKVIGDRPPHIITKELLEYADFAIATSHYTMELPVFQNLSLPKKNSSTSVVYGIGDFDRLEHFQPQPHNTFNVGYIGTVDFAKMHPSYVNMSAAIDIENVCFIVCGGINNYLRHEAEKLGAAERFNFRGYVEDIKSVLEVVDVFGYPLCEDTYATSEKSLQEAMWVGIPPVVFPYGGVKRLVIHNQTGLIVNSETEYKEAIEYLYHHPEERRRLGNNAREYARENFSPENSTKKINEAYDRLLKKPKRKRQWGTIKMSGAELFTQSLGDTAPHFKASLISNNIQELLEAERKIALSSPGTCNAGGGGVFHYRNYYHNDGYLRLWSGLILQERGEYDRAVSEFASAINLGCNHWRVAWYLAKSAEKNNDLALAKKAVGAVLKAAPSFTEAEEMLDRLQSRTERSPSSQDIETTKTIEVSAIVSTYNSEKFIRGCLQDLVEQTLYKKGELEIIVIDSASEENEGEIVREFQAKYPNIVYQRTEKRETLYAAWNRGIQMSRGIYITNANTDDRHRPDALEKMANYLDASSETSLVYADHLITHIANDTWATTQADKRWNWPEFSYEELERRCIIGSQPMWRKSLHDKHGDFRSELAVAGDYEFWLRIGKSENIVRLPEILGLYYDNQQGLEQNSPASARETLRVWEEYGILQRNLPHPNTIPAPVSTSKLETLPYRSTKVMEMVSVIIPCYNYARYLPEAVESVIAQTYENWECIIVNDGSPDNTSEVARSLIQLYPDRNIRLLEKANSGVGDSRNAGAIASSGEYILFLDADDKIHPNFLAETVKLLQEKPDVGFVYTDAQYFGVSNEIIQRQEFIPEVFLRNNQAAVTSLVRKEVYHRAGGFKKVMEQGLEDWEFWISAYEQGWPGYRLAKPYLYYRQHASGARNQTLYNDKNAFSVHVAKIIKLHSQLYTEEEVEQAEQILRERNISLNLLSDDNKTMMTELSLPPESRRLLSALTDLASNYQKEPSDRFALANLRLARKQIADLWLSLPTDELVTAYLGTLGQTHQHLLKSGLKNEPLTKSEQNFVEEILTNLKEGFDKPKAIPYFLAAMLYRRPEQLPLEYDLTKIPQWLFDDYLKFLLNPPVMHSEIGNADKYYSYIQQLADSWHSSILDNPNSTIWQKVANEFSENANFIPLYFNSCNLKDIYVKRAEIIESTLKRQGHQIDYEFPDRGNRKKIRLGILAAHFEPTAETFASLPIYEYISREFEVVLYSLKQTDRPLEQYCRGCANFFTKLPQNLTEQVNTIRADDLDILFIGTNVTAVTNQICLLALHRLARVQVTSVASVVTTGMRNIDYYISGELTDSLESAEQHYQEKLVKLEGTAHCFSYGVEIEEARVRVDRESLGIPENSVIFISGANFFKIIPEAMETWAKIIAAVPNSVLLLMPFGPNWSNAYPKKAFLKQLNSRFSQHGIVASRLIVLDPEPLLNRHDVKEYLKIADVYLDSYPFSGTSSLIEPLEVGLPIISRQGSCFRGAMGGAILRSLDVSDLVADSEESYIELTVALGTNSELRKQKESQIDRKMQANPAFLDSQAYSAKIGTVFKGLFQGYLVDGIRENLRLRELNIIIFPDWSQSEESLYEDLANVLRVAVNHPEKSKMTLLVDTSNIDEEEANLVISSVAMNLMMEEDLDVEEGPEISLVGDLTREEWKVLLSCVRGKALMENEDKNAIAKLSANEVPIFHLHK